MNRIYQGRVCSVEIAKGKNEFNALADDPKEARRLGEELLWAHHELFQDAVNYYVVALASLGNSSESPLTKLRGLLAKVWEVADKKGQHRQGMRESLQRAWQLAQPPTLEEAVEKFRQPLIRNGVGGVEMELAGESLAVDLGGEGSIQQGGIEYWPYFCQSGFKRGVTFPREAAQLAKEKAVKQVARLVWHTKSETHVERIRTVLKQAHFCNVSFSGAKLSQDRAQAVCADALKALEAAGSITETQRQAFGEKLKAILPEIAEYAGGSINKDALKLRFYGFLLFKHLAPDVEGLRILRNIYDKPTKKKAGSKKEPTEKEILEARLASLDDDPIKLVRDRACIVFRAFTALPHWRCLVSSPDLHERSAYADELTVTEVHQVAWKEFDIAAFKEALKVYNQFQQNVKKREEKLTGFATKLLTMDGERTMESYAEDSDAALRNRLRKAWADSKGKPKPPVNDSGEEVTIARFHGDARIDRLRKIINDDLAEAYRLTDGRRTAYGFPRRRSRAAGSGRVSLAHYARRSGKGEEGRKGSAAKCRKRDRAFCRAGKNPPKRPTGSHSSRAAARWLAFHHCKASGASRPRHESETDWKRQCPADASGLERGGKPRLACRGSSRVRLDSPSIAERAKER